MDLEWLLFNGSRTTIAASGLLVVAGVILIKLGERSWHKRAMSGAAVLALVFVVLYMVKSALYRPEKYEGEYLGLYHFVLWSHTVLSVINLPLAVITIYLALKGRLDRHKRIAPYTAGVWIYVATSGWMIFLFHR